MALKESAVDCKFNYYGNVYNKRWTYWMWYLIT